MIKSSKQTCELSIYNGLSSRSSVHNLQNNIKRKSSESVLSITKSRKKSRQSKSNLDFIISSRLSENMSKINEQKVCHKCRMWKVWAKQQELTLLNLQSELIAKQAQFCEFNFSQTKLIKELSEQKQSLMQQLQKERAQYKQIIKQQTINNETFLLQIEQMKQKLQSSNSTPTFDLSKTPTREPFFGSDLKTTKEKLRQIQNEQPAKNLFGSQTVQKVKSDYHVKQDHFYNENCEKDNTQLQKFRFQNQNLKQYNTVLLERLRTSKFKYKK